MAPGVVICWSGFEPRLQTLPLDQGWLVLGRDQVAPSDERMSRAHARIRVVEHGLRVEDLGSRHGTFIDGWEVDRDRTYRMPNVIRTGHTVFAVVPDLGVYDSLDGEPVVGAAMEHAAREIEDAARSEQNVTILAGHTNAMTLADRYVRTIGGTAITYTPGSGVLDLDESLTDTRPRVVVLVLTAHALSFRDMPTVTTWLETDVRFVTLMWPGSNAISMIDPAVGDRLRERVIEVSAPRYDELPWRVRDIVREGKPDARIHPTTIEGMLVRSHQYDEAWVVDRFRKAVAAWDGPAYEHLLRFRHIIHKIDPEPEGAHCLVGNSYRRRSSF